MRKGIIIFGAILELIYILYFVASSGIHLFVDSSVIEIVKHISIQVVIILIIVAGMRKNGMQDDEED